jgi:hypothetical protein
MNRKKIIIVTLCVILLAAVGGAFFYYYRMRTPLLEDTITQNAANPVLAVLRGKKIRKSDVVSEINFQDSISDEALQKHINRFAEMCVMQEVTLQEAEKYSDLPSHKRRHQRAINQTKIGTYMEEESKKVSEADLNAEYLDSKGLIEFDLSVMTFASDKKMEDAYKRLKAGEDFAVIAKRIAKEPVSEFGFVRHEIIQQSFGKTIADKIMAAPINGIVKSDKKLADRYFIFKVKKIRKTSLDKCKKEMEQRAVMKKIGALCKALISKGELRFYDGDTGKTRQFGVS